jgi:hypothetical protein
MTVGLLDSVVYWILPNSEAVVYDCDESVTTLLPRNCVALRGNRCSVAHMNATRLRGYVKTIIVPYSLRSIFAGNDRALPPSDLNALVFESGSELWRIAPGAFTESPLRSVFVPQSVRLIGNSAFSSCYDVACIHLDRHSSFGQLTSTVFSQLGDLSAITIPTSVTRIQCYAFQYCGNLRYVTFELPSQCRRIAYGAFWSCHCVKSVSLPPSVEFIDQAISLFALYAPRYLAPESPHFYRRSSTSQKTTACSVQTVQTFST